MSKPFVVLFPRTVTRNMFAVPNSITKGNVRDVTNCKDFVPFDYSCPKTKKAPYVCNGCSKKSGCRLDKYYYRATRAHKEYKTILVESRAGINASEEEIKALDDIISPLVENGQSVYTMESYSQYPPKITMHSSFLSFPISIISFQTNKSPYFLILPSKLSFLLSFFTSLSSSSL